MSYYIAIGHKLVLWNCDNVWSATGQRCPNAWYQEGDKCYWFSRVQKTFDDAQAFCAEREGRVVVIADNNELDTLKRLRNENGEKWETLSPGSIKFKSNICLYRVMQKSVLFHFCRCDVLRKTPLLHYFAFEFLLYAHVVDYYACVHIVPSICLSVSIEYTDSVYWVGSQAGGAASRCLEMDSKQRGYTIDRGACSTKQDYICESRLHFSSACLEYTCMYLVAFIALLLIFLLACNHMWGLVLFKSWTSEWFDSKTIR